MFSQALSYVGTGIKRTIIPAFISTGRIISAIGDSLFSLDKFIKYMTNQDNHPSNLYSSIGVIISSGIVNASTRVPAIFKHFRSSGEDISPNEHDSTQLEYVNEEDATKINIKTNFFCSESELGCKGMSIYIVLKTLNIAAIPFTFLASYLNAITFIEFIAKNGFHTDAHDDILEYVTQSASLALAICGSATFAIYTLKRANHNARKFAEMVENKNFTFDKATVSTIAIITLGTTTVPFLAFFSASNALTKIPLVVFPEKIKYTIAGIGSLTRTVTTLLTQTSPLYSVLTTQPKAVQYTITPMWEKPLKALVYTAGLAELAATGIANFTGFVSTSQDVFGINAKNPGLVSIGAITGTVNATLYFFFSVHEGLKQTITNAKQTNAAYLSIAQNEDNVSLSLMDSDHKPYRKSSSLMLFSEDDLSETRENLDSDLDSYSYSL